MEPLPLREIHLPDPIHWWPPAIGWWALLALTLLVAAGVIYRLRRKPGVNPATLAFQALAKLEADTATPVPEKLQALSILMKRLALTLHPRATVAGLTGEDWLLWLDTATGDTRFSQGAGRWLAEAPYRRAPDATVLAELLELCRDWVKAVDTVNSSSGPWSFRRRTRFARRPHNGSRVTG